MQGFLGSQPRWLEAAAEEENPESQVAEGTHQNVATRKIQDK